MDKREIRREMHQKLKGFTQVRNAFFMGNADERELMEQTTQPFWQSMRLSRKRLQEKGLTAEVTFTEDKRRAEGKKGEISVESDGADIVGKWSSEVTACHSYYKNGKRIHRKKEKEIFSARFLKSDVRDGQVCCPNCGYVGSVSSFTDGCDSCGTKFSVHDFETKISGFSMEENIPKKIVQTMVNTMRVLLLLSVGFILLGTVTFFVIFLMLAAGHDSGMGIIGTVIAFLFSLDAVPVTVRSLIALLMIYLVSGIILWGLNQEVLTGGEYARAKIKNFSGTEFFQNLEYKLRSIHLTDIGPGIQTFATCNLQDVVADYKDVVDCDMTRLKITQVSHKQDKFFMDAVARLRLTTLRKDRIRTAYEDVALSLECREDVAMEKVSAIRMYKCDCCGSSINILEGSTCEYCGTRFDYANYGWTIGKYEKISRKWNRYYLIKGAMLLVYLLIFAINILTVQRQSGNEDNWLSVYKESRNQLELLNRCFEEAVLPDEVWSDAELVDSKDDVTTRTYRYRMEVTEDTLTQYCDACTDAGYMMYISGPTYLGMWKEYYYEPEDTPFYIRIKAVTMEDGLAVQLEMVEDLNEDAQIDTRGAVEPEEGTAEGVTQGNEPEEVTLIMVGDILLHDPVEESARTDGGEYDFSAIFAHTREEIEAADVALVNQEVIIGGEELQVSGYPAFNAPYAIGDELVESGFDVICHGTNHALDRGKSGIVNCVNFWDQNYPDIAVLGIHGSEEDRDNLFIYEQDGIKIAILNYTYGTNGIELPSDMPYAVELLREDAVVADLQCAEELADFTIVCPHWGTEYNLGTDSMQRKWTQIFAENGADLVIGTHPHVIEPIEWFHEEESGNDMLVYYSLGNFVNWTSGTGAGTANRMVGGMAQVTIGRDGDGNAVITDYGVKALVCHVSDGFGGVTTYNLSDYTAELAAQNRIADQDSAFSYEYAVDLCDTVWGDLWE